ncbi:chromosome segregation ATPase [Sporosarcina luteola]|nr:chromosome segregation ATPase [Sporosarcina luteola]
MSQPISQETILQAILELSAQVKGNRDELKSDIAEIKSDIAEIKADIVTLKADVETLKADVDSIKGWMAKTDERLETIDAKMDVFTKGLLDTQAEVVKLKKVL